MKPKRGKREGVERNSEGEVGKRRDKEKEERGRGEREEEVTEQGRAKLEDKEDTHNSNAIRRRTTPKQHHNVNQRSKQRLQTHRPT